MKIFLKIILVFLLFFAVFSCKKETDEENPGIKILVPENNTVFSVLDTIVVKAEISDNEQLISVNCYIEDENAEIISGVKTFKASGKNYTLQTVIILNDIRIKTAYYNLVVSASDGTNRSKAYRRIHLTTVPKQLENIYFISRTNSNIYRLKNNVFELKKSFGFNLSSAGVLHYYDIIYLLDKSGNLHNINLDNFSTNWTVQGLNDPLHDYNGMIQISDSYCYVSTKESNILAYDINGNIRKKAISLNHAYQAGQFIISASSIYHNATSGEINQNIIERFNSNTGASLTTNIFNYEIIKMLELNEEEIIVFSNKNDSLYITRFGEMYNGERPFHCDFPQEITDVIKLNDKYIFSTNTGLYSFDTGTEFIVNINNENQIKHLYYEELSNKIYLQTQTELKILDAQNLSIENVINLPEQNGIIVFDYNKP